MRYLNRSFILVAAATAFVLSGCEGPAGPAGPAGAACTVTAGDGGAKTITCPDGTSVTLTDGKAGTIPLPIREIAFGQLRSDEKKLAKQLAEKLKGVPGAR